MFPSSSTSTEPVNACVSLFELMRFGSLHDSPPSVELAITIWSLKIGSGAASVKRMSCQTMWTLSDLRRGSAAASTSRSPVRIGAPSRGSTTP